MIVIKIYLITCNNINQVEVILIKFIKNSL